MLASLASAAPVPVHAGGRDLLLSPLSDRDFDELSLWFQARVLRVARASLGPDSTPQEREETMRAAYAHAATIDFFTEYNNRSKRTQAELDEATAQLIWRALRKNHPAISLEDARAVIRSEASAEVVDAWRLAQFGKAPAAKDDAEDPGKNVEARAPAA